MPVTGRSQRYTCTAVTVTGSIPAHTHSIWNFFDFGSVHPIQIILKIILINIEREVTKATVTVNHNLKRNTNSSSLVLSTVELTGTKLARQDRAAAARGIS